MDWAAAPGQRAEEPGRSYWAKDLSGERRVLLTEEPGETGSVYSSCRSTESEQEIEGANRAELSARFERPRP